MYSRSKAASCSLKPLLPIKSLPKGTEELPVPITDISSVEVKDEATEGTSSLDEALRLTESPHQAKGNDKIERESMKVFSGLILQFCYQFK